MKVAELRKKDKKELERDLNHLKENLGSLRLKLAANKLKNVREIRNIKKNIARILTVNNEKQ